VGVRAPAKRFAGRTRFAVRPYPAEWERRIEVRDGWTIDARPVRPEDEPAIIRLLQQVSREDLRLRFFHSVKEFSHQFTARLTQLDYARAMAFAAIDPASGDILGVVRLHSDSRYERAEYAILLRSDLKGKGLGWALMQLLIEYARSEGLQSLFGEVLNENTTMLAMCRELGFEVKADPNDAGTALVSLDLTTRSIGVNDNATLVRHGLSASAGD
jgi:acetyltransferase